MRFLQTFTLLATVASLLLFAGNSGVHADNGEKLALVIGNGEYAVNPIATAANDAEQIAATLKELGFSVALRRNLDRDRMLKTIDAYEKSLAGADIGLFIYVGHGVQYQKTNYLVPLGAQVESDWQIKEQCVSLNDVAHSIAQSGVKAGVLMIDAARPNPLGTRFSPPQSGLAEMTLPDNMHIILADAPNRLTRQGGDPLPDVDSISGFTETFLNLLKQVPDLPIDQFLRQLQLAVAVKSKQERKPWFRLGKNRSISLDDTRALFAKKLKVRPQDSSFDQAREFMAEALNGPKMPVHDDQTTDQIAEPKSPWIDNPILIFHTLLRDLEKLYDIRQMKLPENFYQAGLSVINAKYGYLIEDKAVTETPETLLQRAFTHNWPWPDPFLSPELAAKTIAAEAAKEAEAMEEEADLEKETETEKETVSTPQSQGEDVAESLDPIEEYPVEITNPAIAQLKSSLILDRQKELLKVSRLPWNIKQTALAAADDYAQELSITAASPAVLLERALSIHYQQGRRAVIISDGEIDQTTAMFIKALEERGFVVTTTSDSDLWHEKITALIDKLTVEDVSLIYVVSDRIALNDLIDAMASSTNALNLIIMDPSFSLERPSQPIEKVYIPSANMAVLLADTPIIHKKDDETPINTLLEKTPLFTLPEGPLMAQALTTHLDKPGQPLNALFQNVQKEVATTTENQRTPWWIYGIDAASSPFQFNDSRQNFTHLLEQLDVFRYLEAVDATPQLFELGWKALVRNHPEWTWFVEKGDLNAVLKRALASDTADERHTIALKKGLLPRFTNEKGMSFIYQPKGEFLMGSFPDEAGHKKDEAITEKSISGGYYLMQTEVTQGQWQMVMEKNLASFDGCGPDCPVETVSWYDAQVFIKQLNGEDQSQADLLPAAFQRRWKKQIEQKPWHVFGKELNQYVKSVGTGDFLYRLPTEAEWEFACRSGRQTMFGFGGELWRLPEYAWYNENSLHSTQPVATKQSSINGYYDLHGNVWEWCQDGQGRFKTVRGGSWYYDGLATRCANRYYVKPTEANYNVGLRLVAVPVPTR